MNWKPLLIALAVTAALPAAAEGPEPVAAGAGGGEAAVVPAPAAAAPAATPATAPAVTPAPAAESVDVKRERLLREIDLAELELKLAKLRADRALVEPVAVRPAAAPPAAVPTPAPPSVPVPAAAPTPAATAVVTPPAPLVQAAPVRPSRPVPRATVRSGKRADGTVGYLAQAGELRALVSAGGARLRAVAVDPRKPLLRPGVGVIADPVADATAMPLADAGAAAGTGSSAQRIQRVLGGGGSGGEDLRGLGLPPPLPGLPAGGGQP